MIQCVDLCDWLLSLGTMSLRFIRAAACVIASFCFVAEQWSVVRMDQFLFIRLTVDGHFYCFYFLDIINNIK